LKQTVAVSLRAAMVDRAVSCSMLKSGGEAAIILTSPAERPIHVATIHFCGRSRKMARISSADGAVARLSRVLRSFRNLAIEASVRRCV
jgi:hypothetical protein